MYSGKTRGSSQPLDYIADDMLMQCQRACSTILRDEAENNQEITAEHQINFPSFKQNLAEKRKFCHLTSQQKPAAV